ncbi:hypothetical protein GCM10027294_06670 [Marinactinospora endophytica]
MGEIWTLQLAAYVFEAQACGDPCIPPLTETVPQIRSAMDQGALLLKATRGGRIVGAARGRSAGRTFLIGRLAVAPDQRRRGLGRTLAGAIERYALERHPGLSAFALTTTHTGDAGLRLYRGLGYQETTRERIAGHLTMVHLRKEVPGRVPIAGTP